MSVNLAVANRDQLIEELSAVGSPYEVRSENVRGIELPVFANAPANLRGIYAEQRDDEEAIFLVYEDERLAFAEVHRRAATLAWRLRERFGIRPGDRVAIAMRNYPEWCLAFMATTSLGAVAVTLNAWWKGEELEYGLRDSGAKLVFADAERLDRLLPLLPGLGVELIAARAGAGLPQGVHDFGALLGDLEHLEFPDAEIARDADAAIMYTSGSSGHPKGVVVTHRGIISAVLNFEFGIALARRQAGLVEPPRPRFAPCMLLSVPLFHVTGSHVQFLMSFRFKRKLVMMHRWDAEKALALIERERVTEFNGVPTMSADLLNSPDFQKRDLSSLRGIGGGGAARPPEQVRRIPRSLEGGIPSTGYGLTETNAVGATIWGPDYLGRPASVGRASPPLVRIQIVDERGESLPPNQSGEIAIKSAVNMRCYWNKPEATAKVLRDGWLRTGDIGLLDEEGFLFITDRAKDIVIRGGENISCLEVEGVLYEHPGVIEAAVFGIPDPRLGEALAAVVVMRPGHAPGEQELREHVGEHLATFKVPSRIWVRDEKLPRIASGKLAKRQIKQGVIASLG
jgi:long-chain acyl-CoA synthetase